MKIPGTKIKERLSISDCFSWDVTLCSPLHWYHTTLYHSIQNNLVYLESHPRNTKSSSFYSPYRITLRSETVRPLQYGAETKEKRLTAGEETVSNARRLYVVPGTGGGVTKSYLVHSTCNTRTCHPSTTGGSTHSRENEQVKDGPGDVRNYLHTCISFFNSAGHQVSGHDRGQNTGTDLHYLYRVNILNVDEFNILLSMSWKICKLKLDILVGNSQVLKSRYSKLQALPPVAPSTPLWKMASQVQKVKHVLW